MKADRKDILIIRSTERTVAMKKIALLILALLLVFSSFASAETYFPEFTVNMEEEFTDGVYDVGFTTEDIDDRYMYVSIYEEVIFDTVAVHEMKVGDRIDIYEDVEIKTLTKEDDGSININGGYEEGGFTLVPADEGGIYKTRDYEYQLYIIRGLAQLTMADEVELEYWYQNSDGSVAADNKTAKVPCNKLRETIVEKLEADAFYPGSATVEIENGLVVKVKIDYAPFG